MDIAVALLTAAPCFHVCVMSISSSTTWEFEIQVFMRREGSQHGMLIER
jgi:hypothetical protein